MSEPGEDLNSQLGYLRAAAGWLTIAEREFEELKDGVLQEGGREYIPRGGGYALLTEGSARLAELNIAMARACGEHRIYMLQRKVPQRYALAEEPEARSAEEVQRLVREQLKADDDAHQGETLHPGIDPEPVAEGELWTDDVAHLGGAGRKDRVGG
jgi:hypothetical protein